MTELKPLTGDLQTRIMPVLWRLEAATVEQVREALPRRHRSAYNTVQTVLNRLAERGLLSRRREGSTIVYRPRVSEGDFVSRNVQSALDGASLEARQVVLARLVGRLEPTELRELQILARQIGRPLDHRVS
jgi:predicted transcriptional regulator